MDDSHPLAWLLQMCFGDEHDDAVATDALRLQMTVYRDHAARFREALAKTVAARDEVTALAAVEQYANRDVQGSGPSALAWLEALQRRLGS